MRAKTIHWILLMGGTGHGGPISYDDARPPEPQSVGISWILKSRTRLVLGEIYQ